MLTTTDRGIRVLLLNEPFTSLKDYDRWLSMQPDDRHFEVVDGLPILSPSPSGAHQLALVRLVRLISASLPDGHEILPAPWDWVLQEKPRLTIREPDLVVVRRDQITDRLRSTPLLAIEILSPTSVERDVVAKRREYAAVGLRNYWIVNPTAPQVAIYQLIDSELRLVATADGDTPLVLDEPFPVSLRPVDLIS